MKTLIFKKIGHGLPFWLAPRGYTQSIIHTFGAPPNFLPEFYEPRFAMDWLTSFDFALGFGSTHTGRDGDGTKVPLLDIYGLYPMQALGINVPGKDLSRPGDIVLTQLALLPPNDGFATLSYGGKFQIIEANFSFSQNLTCGFFVQAHLPVRRLQITDITVNRFITN